MSFPRLTATGRELRQTRSICNLRGWRYYPTEEEEHRTAHVFDGSGRELVLEGGRFSLEHVVKMLEEEGCYFEHYGEEEADTGWWVANDSTEMQLKRCAPHDVSAGMEALIIIEKKKRAAKKP